MILIVDDSVLVALDMEDFFQRNSQIVCLAHSRDEFIELWNKHAEKVTAVVLDHELHGESVGMDLHDVIRTDIRDVHRRPEERVFIAIHTGWDKERVLERREPELIGTPFAFLEKPVSEKNLGALLTLVAERRPWDGRVISPNKAKLG